MKIQIAVLLLVAFAVLSMAAQCTVDREIRRGPETQGYTVVWCTSPAPGVVLCAPFNVEWTPRYWAYGHLHHDDNAPGKNNWRNFHQWQTTLSIEDFYADDLEYPFGFLVGLGAEVNDVQHDGGLSQNPSVGGAYIPLTQAACPPMLWDGNDLNLAACWHGTFELGYPGAWGYFEAGVAAGQGSFLGTTHDTVDWIYFFYWLL